MSLGANSVLEVDLNILCKNMQSIVSALPAQKRIIPVLKADAYGLGTVPVAKALLACGDAERVPALAVAQLYELRALRAAGIASPVIILGGLPSELAAEALALGATLTLYHPSSALALNALAEKAGRRAPVQLKLETGLGRIGVRPGAELAALLDALRTCRMLELDGVFTHLAEGENHGGSFTLQQLALLREGLAQIARAGFSPSLLHISNSGASEWLDDAPCNALRIGRRLYMDSRDHPRAPEAPGAVGEVASWRSEIINLRRFSAGESVGYDGVFRPERSTLVATVCVGYGDGLYQPLAAARAPVLAAGRRAALVGVCMDMSLVDVTGLPCRVGDEIVFFGRSKAHPGAFLSAQEVAATVGHEGVYLTSLLSQRVRREYIGGAPALGEAGR